VFTSSYSLLVFLFFGIAVDDGTDGLEGSLGGGEGVLHGGPDLVEDLASLLGSLLGGLAVLLDVGSSYLSSLSHLLLLVGASDLVEGIQSVHEGAVLKRVLLGDVLDDGGLDHSELGLDLVGVDDSGEIGAVHHVSVENIATLLDVGSSVVSEDAVEGLEGFLSPDDESAEVTTRGELEEVESGDVHEVNSGEVSSGSLNVEVLLSVDNEGTASEDVSGVSEFALAGSHLLGISGSLHVLGGTDALEDADEGLGRVSVEGLNDERKLRHVGNSVTSGEDEGSHSGGSDGDSNGVSLLVDVDLSVPLSVGLQGSEHSTLAAHVTEGTLA
jgi:hypothetical protein